MLQIWPWTGLADLNFPRAISSVCLCKLVRRAFCRLSTYEWVLLPLVQPFQPLLACLCFGSWRMWQTSVPWESSWGSEFSLPVRLRARHSLIAWVHLLTSSVMSVSSDCPVSRRFRCYSFSSTSQMTTVSSEPSASACFEHHELE